MKKFNKSQKKYLKKNLHQKSLQAIAIDLDLPLQDLQNYLLRLWGKTKYQKFINRQQQSPKISSFKLKPWLKQNQKSLLFVLGLATLVYSNSLNNQFVSDDIPAILTNPNLDQFNQILSSFPVITRNFLYFIINQFFGKIPFFYRLLNFTAHLGSVFLVYLLVDLLSRHRAALLASLLVAVHPLLSETVVWISAGPYTQYAFLALLSLTLFLLKRHWLAFASFILALTISERTIIFPLILLAYSFSFRPTFNWKKILPYFIISALWALFFLTLLPQRQATLQADFSTPSTQKINPFQQIPIALSSYLELFFWPQNLTLYHSEMSFTTSQFTLKLIFALSYFLLLFFVFKRSKPIFFWLSLFIIGLLPSLTPFGVSWIVAERYVYLSAIGLCVSLGILLSKLKINYLFPIAFIIIFALATRTIIRNNDWQDQDHLWLAAAKTSPNSSQNHNNLGDLYSRRNNPERSIFHFQKAIELNPNYAEAYHNLANTYQNLNQIDLAIQNYQKALELRPTLWQSRQALDQLLTPQ
jgi:tetratricopeptide (TPR) repeat protein